jgi:hypothetical protein
LRLCGHPGEGKKGKKYFFHGNNLREDRNFGNEDENPWSLVAGSA